MAVGRADRGAVEDVIVLAGRIQGSGSVVQVLLNNGRGDFDFVSTLELGNSGRALQVGNLELTDAVVILSSLFLGVAVIRCRDAADVDDNATIVLTDAIFLLNHLFQGGLPPAPPGVAEDGACGTDPPNTPSLGCVSYDAC
jgi:hypothetical protein